jgi:spore coat polysaccharide biosynthesis protein SpsF
VEVLTQKTLKTLWQTANLFSEREHVTIHIANHPDLFHTSHLSHGEDLSAKRWTMDYPEDYELLRIVFENLYPVNPLFGMRDVLDFLSDHPELESINAHIRVDDGVRKSMQADRIVPSTEPD